MQEGKIFNLACIQNIKETQVPLIPKEIQDKIVNLIYSIKENTSQCISKLYDEITLRKNQLANILNPLPSEESLKRLYKLHFDRDLEIKWTTLEKIATLKLGPKLTKKMIEKSPGPYPVYSSATLNDGETGRINSYMYDGEYVTWTTDGYAGEVFYRNGKFNINSKCGIVIINSNVDINMKFLCYWLRIAIKYNMQEGAMFNYAYVQNVKETLVPLIPREIQDKLVNLIDPIKEYTSQCISKLNDEITLRKKQLANILKTLPSEESLKRLYKLYFGRDLEIKWTTLGEMATLKRGPTLTTKMIAKSPGPYPVYSAATLNDGEIGRINSYMYDGEYVTWTTRGNAGTVFYRNGKFNITSDSGIVLVKQEIDINRKFLYYWLNTVMKDYVQIAIIGNNAPLMNVIEVPVPLIPKELQDKLISIIEPADKLLKQYISLLENEIQLRNKELQGIHQELFNFSSENN